MPHIHDKIDFTVDIYIVHQNKVLLRHHDKYHRWLAVGGHIELDEDPNTAAIREAQEEVGLTVTLDNSRRAPLSKQPLHKELIPPYFMNMHAINKTHQHLSHIYFATSEINTITEPETHEKSNGCRWYTKEELLNDREIEEHIKQDTRIHQLFENLVFNCAKYSLEEAASN